MNNLYTTPPSARLQEKLHAFKARFPDFRGRVGFMHYRDAQGNDEVEFAKEPSGLSPAIDPLTLSLDRLLPALSEEQTPRVTFVNGFGMPFKLKDVLNDLFKDYPDKPFHQGGEQLEKRKGQWRGALVRALNSPTVLLLSTFNSVYRAQGATLIEVREAWLGESPAWEVRHDQTFYAPYSAYRPLIDALLVGHDHDEVRPHADDNTPLDLPVLFEDEYCVVVNKPSRLASVPGIRESISAKALLEKSRGPLWVVHRLDLDTSGVLLFAKSAQACEAFSACFRNDHQVQKTYCARLEGDITPWTGVRLIDFPIAVNPLDRPRQCVLGVDNSGKEARSEVRYLGTVTSPTGPKALVELKPKTGRTHQLRLHCAHALGLGVAIDGDPFYSHLGLLSETSATRLCLHAASLALTHPITGEALSVSAPFEFPLF